MSSSPSRKLYLGCDISLNSPGFAVIEDMNGKLSLLDSFAVKASSKMTTAQKLERIEDELYNRLLKYGKFDLIIREKFASPNPNTSYAVFAAWGSVDRALFNLDGQCVTDAVAQSRVKKLVTGSGGAEKSRVQEAVLKYLGLPHTHDFRTSDESDAAAVVLGYLIQEGLIST